MSKDNTKKQVPDSTSSINDENIGNGDEMPESLAEEHLAESQDTYESFSASLDPKTDTAPQEQKNKKAETQSAIKPGNDEIRIQTLQEQLDRTKEQMIRALAEAENTRKRAIKERQDASKFAVSNFARDLLNVADNLRRALEAVPENLITESPQVKNLINGIEATERELIQCFNKNGIKKLEPMGEKFDPNFHEVMFETPVPNQEDGTIIQLLEPGYTINERILRPARVGIAKNVDAQPHPDSSGTGQTIDTEA